MVDTSTLLYEVFTSAPHRGRRERRCEVPVHAAARSSLDLGAGAVDDRFNRAIEDIENELTLDDPGFVRRMRREARGESTNASIIVVLLVVAVPLLAIGLAVNSWVAFVAGALAFVAASVIDDGGRESTSGPDSGPSSVGLETRSGKSSQRRWSND
jgi:hypothetical protein